MNDYIIDERLIREFKDVTTNSERIKEPVPRKYPCSAATMQLSSNATYKKEKSDLEFKFKNLEKAHNKLIKKNSEAIEDMKFLKSTNDALTKELNILQITNEKLSCEKLNIENQLEENKNYTRKLESRLVAGAKNQYLVEINNKLRKEIEDVKKASEEKFGEVEKLKNEICKKNQEIKIFNKALEIRTDDLRFKGDAKSSLLYDVGLVKQELDDYKENFDNLTNLNEKLKREIDDKLSKIQELNFAKAHLTELLLENENKVHNLEVEKDSYEKHCQTLKDERVMLREYIEKITADLNSTKESLEEENKTLSTKLREAEAHIVKRDETVKKLNIELESFKINSASITDKSKNLEISLKTKINEIVNLETQNKEYKDNNSILEETKEELERENAQLCENVNNLNIQLQNLEKDNLDLMKKNKTLLISQESFQSELVKQNQHLQNTELKLKEQIQKLNSEIEKIREEKNDLKKMMNEAINKCTSIMKEKTDVEKELNKKDLQIENLKNTNILLHKNFSKTHKEKSKENEEEIDDNKLIKIGESKIEENNMINLIRREKEKNKEFLEEIKRLKNNI